MSGQKEKELAPHGEEPGEMKAAAVQVTEPDRPEEEAAGGSSVPLDVGEAYRAHGAFIGRVIQRLVGYGPHVDDILQEVFIVAHKKRDEFDGRCAVSSWLYGIATRMCMRHNRGNRRFRVFQGRLSREDSQTRPEQPDENIEREQTIEAVHDCLQKMPFKQREVFVLYELEEMKGNEIAEMVGVPVGTVWTRLHQARKTFTRLMRRRTVQEDVSSGSSEQ